MGTSDEDSDIDIIVVLDENGFLNNYSEVIKRRQGISALFRDIKKEFPMDILVYSRDEWDMLLNSNSSFIREINSTGIRLL